MIQTFSIAPIAFEKLTLQMVDQFITDLSRRGAQNAMPSESYLFAFEDILNEDSLSPAYRAKVLEMPSENYIAENRVLMNRRSFAKPAI